MRILVTGAAGFLGRHVVAQLLERGQQVRAMIRPATGTLPQEWRERVEVARVDLRARDALERHLEGVDVLVHLAATVRGTPEEQFVGTAVGTENLLEAVRRAGRPRRIVLAGSCAVYDWSAASRVLSEESPLEANLYDRDGYAIAKTWQERVARRLAAENGWTLSVLRPGLIYGPGAAPAASAGIRLGRMFLVIAPLARLRLTHVANCAAAFADAALAGAEGTFNIVDDEQVSAWRYAGRLHRNVPGVVRVPVPYVLGLATAHAAQWLSRVLFPPGGGKLPGILRPRHFRARFRPMRYDNGRAKQGLGWAPKPYFGTGCAVV